MNYDGKDIVVEHCAVTLAGGIHSFHSVLLTNAASLIMKGGGLRGGTITTTNGSAVVATDFGGTLNAVTLNGTLNMASNVYDATVVVTNGLVLNGTVYVGHSTKDYFSRLRFAGSQAITGNGTIVFGANSSYYGSANALGLEYAGTTLTIGPTITLRGKRGCIQYSGAYSATTHIAVVNQGTVLADETGGKITITASPLINEGLLATSNGGTLELAGKISNTGVFGGTNGLIALTGVFTNRSSVTIGQPIEVRGMLDNRGSAVRMTGTNRLTIIGGTLIGGTLITTNGGAVVADSFHGGVLNGITLYGVLDVGGSVSSGEITITNGLALYGTAIVGNATNMCSGSIDFGGTQAITGNGTIVFGNNAYSGNFLRLTYAGTRLTIGPKITVRGQNGTLGYNSRFGGPSDVAVVNQGTIVADVSGGTITIAASPLTNEGLLATANGGTLSLAGKVLNSGAFGGATGRIDLAAAFTNRSSVAIDQPVQLSGTLDNRGAAVRLTGANCLTVTGGTVIGGSLVATNGGSVLVGAGGCRMDGVTVNGLLDVGATFDEAVLTVTNGLVLNGRMQVGNPDGADSSPLGTVMFEGTQTLDGHGTVVFGGSTSIFGDNALQVRFKGTTLTLGPQIVVRGLMGTVGYSEDPGSKDTRIVNLGTISADEGSLVGFTNVIRICASPFINKGHVEIQGGWLLLGGSVLNEGLFEAGRGAVLLSGAWINTNRVLSLDALDALIFDMLSGGRIEGGEVISTNRFGLVVDDGTLDGVTVNGGLYIGRLTVTNGLVLNGTLKLGTDDVAGTAKFDGSQFLSGHATVLFGANTANVLGPSLSGSTLTLGPSVVLRGKNGTVGYSALTGGPQDVGIVNQGFISADVSGGTIQCGGQRLTNSGSIAIASGATLDWAGDLRMDGGDVIESQPGATLKVKGELVGSTRNADRYLPQGTLSFASGLHVLEAMSQDRGNTLEGYLKNFAYGRIALGTGAQVRLVDQSTNSAGTQRECVYVTSLIVPANSTLDLNGFRLYAQFLQVSGRVTNGSISQTLISGGAVAPGVGAPGLISVLGAAQAWTFFGRAGRSVAVSLDTGSASLLPPYLKYGYVRLLDPLTNVLAQASNTVSQQVVALTNITLPKDGMYTVLVSAPANHSSSTGNYVVTVWDTTSDVATLEVNRQHHGSIETPYSVDRWTFSSQAKQQVRLKVLETSSPGVAFDLKGPAGWIGFTNLTGNSELITLPASGTYTLVARGTGGAYGINYAFVLEQVAQAVVSAGGRVSGQLVGNGQALLFRVDVTNSSPMRIELLLSPPGGHVECYVKFGLPPTRSDWDYKYVGANASVETILIPSAAIGTWYILVYGDYLRQSTSYELRTILQDVFVTGNEPKLFSTAVDGQLVIEGAGFDAGALVSLVASNGTHYQVQNVDANSPSRLITLITSNSVPGGIYGICVSSGNGSACLTNALTMVEGGKPEFQVRIITPGKVGYHHRATIYVEYSNTGSATMPAPLLLVTATQNSRANAFLTLDSRLSQNAFSSEHEQPGFSHSVQLLASGKVPGWLQPGESYRIPIYYAGWKRPWDMSHPPIRFLVSTRRADNRGLIDWARYAVNSRPAGITTGQWMKMLDGFQARFGNTWGGYVTALDSLVDLITPVAGPAYDVSQLFDIVEQQVTGFGLCQLSGQVVDVSTNRLVPNTKVVARQQITATDSVLRSTTTDGSGSFAFTNLPPGIYQLFVEGYRAANSSTSYRLPLMTSLRNIIFTVTPLEPIPSVPSQSVQTNDSSPCVAVDGAGTPHMVWNRGAEIWHAYHNGTNWVSTGSVPGAVGAEPTLVASSRLLDAASAGLMVSWRKPNTNGSGLYFSACRTGAGTQSWLFSSPKLLSETNLLDNQGLALAVRVDGQVVAVWQKRHHQIRDDTDLYYQALNLSTNTLDWLGARNPPTFAPRQLSLRGQNCYGLQFEIGKREIPHWVLGTTGTLGVRAAGEYCGEPDGCSYTREISGEVSVELPLSVGYSVALSGKEVEKANPQNCQYEFDSAEVSFQHAQQFDYQIIPNLGHLFWIGGRAVGFEGSVGIHIGVSMGGAAEWKGVGFPSWPTKSSLSFGGSIGPYGRLLVHIPWPLSLDVEGQISGLYTFSIGLQRDESGVSTTSEWADEFQIQVTVGCISYTFKREFSSSGGDEGSVFQPLAAGSQGVIITVSPTHGTTNVYAGNPVSADVATNAAEDGPPSMTVTTAGETFLAWAMDSENPTNWLGSRVLVSRLSGSSWSTPIEVPASRGFNSDVKVGCDAGGHPLVVWAMASNAGTSLKSPPDALMAAMGSNDVVFSTFNGTTWSLPARIAVVPGTKRQVTLGQAVDGTLMAAWLAESEQESRICTAFWDGVAWSAPSMLTTGQFSGKLSIAAVAEQTTVFWTRKSDGQTNETSHLGIEFCNLNSVTRKWSAPRSFDAGRSTLATIPSGDIPRAKASSLPGLGTPPSDCCTNQPPPPPDQPEPDPGDDDGSDGGDSSVPESNDPNAKLGPAGFGPGAFVAVDDAIPYLIEFENATNATAPAQIVRIKDPLDLHLDWSTFTLGQIGFGTFVIDTPPYSQHFTTNVVMSYDGESFEVQIEAGIDFATGQVYADFYSIDPVTGLPPSVTVGFLPPEDGTGRGQGYVSYFIWPKEGLATGTRITNIAFIQFDENTVISTDQVDPHDVTKGFDSNKVALVTIDSTPPASSVLALPAVEGASTFQVSWSGADVGSGVRDYDIHVKTNAGPWGIWQAGVSGTSAIFTGEVGATYAFYCVAWDNVGNLESKSPAPEAKTTVLLCNYQVTPESAEIGSKGGTNTVSVAAQNGCVWSAVNTNAWITVLHGMSGTNNGTVVYRVAANTNLLLRSGNLLIAEQLVTVNQNGTETTKPTLAITNGPAAGAKLTNAVVSLRGKAQDKAGVLRVQYQLANAAGTSAWLPALGTTQWSMTLSNVVIGTNTVRLRAQDLAGNYSAEQKRTFTRLAPLTIQLSGCGSLTPSLTGTTFQEKGKRLTIEAKPCPGNLFSNWTGGIFTNSAKISFAMPSNLVLQANFVSNRFLPAKGSFNGLFYETNGVRSDRSGFITLALTDQGAYSGNIQLNGQRCSLSGKFALDGTASNLIARTKQDPLVVQLVLQDPENLGGSIRSSLSNAVWMAKVVAGRAVFDEKKRPAPYAGLYTLVIAGTNGTSVLPGGNGYGTVALSKAGLITFAGVLSDSTKISQGVPVSADGLWPLYASLYGGRGSVLSWVGFTNAASLGGDLVWTKPPTNTTFYPAGFVWLTETLGSRYVAPGKGLNAFGATNSQLVLVLDGGNLFEPVSNQFTLDAKNTVKNPSLTNQLQLKFTPASGLFSGSQMLPGNAAKITFNGVLLQTLTNGQGHFLGTNQSGRVNLRLQ